MLLRRRLMMAADAEEPRYDGVVLTMPDTNEITFMVRSAGGAITAKYTQTGGAEAVVSVTHNVSTTLTDVEPNSKIYISAEKVNGKGLTLLDGQTKAAVFDLRGALDCTITQARNNTTVREILFHSDARVFAACETHYYFTECTNLERVEFPNGFTIVLSYAFMGGCTKLYYVKALGLGNVCNSAFYDCTSLAVVDMPSLTDIYRNGFVNCRSLATLTLPSPTMVTIMVNAFSGTTTTIKVPSELLAEYQATYPTLTFAAI